MAQHDKNVKEHDSQPRGNVPRWRFGERISERPSGHHHHCAGVNYPRRPPALDGGIKPHKTSHVAGQTTPAPEPVLNLMPVRHYDADGLQFSYYADWTIEKGVPIDGATTLRSIRIEGPGHGTGLSGMSPTGEFAVARWLCGAVPADDRAQSAIATKRARGHRMPPDAVRPLRKPSPRKWPATRYKGIHQHFSINDQGLPVSQDSVFF